MSRMQIELPVDLPFETTLDVRITEINYGGHVGNDALLGLLQEARIRMLATADFSEVSCGGPGIIMLDAAVIFKAEIFYGNKILIRTAFAEPSRIGCEIYYLVTESGTDRELARARTGIAFFDYAKRKIAPMPQPFRDRFFSGTGN